MAERLPDSQRKVSEIKKFVDKSVLSEEVSCDACVILKKIVPSEMQILNQDFKQVVRGGEFSLQQLCFRDQVLAPGVEVRRDIGLTFYKVQPGDTILKIRQKLQLLPEFAYLKDLSDVGINSFNINPKYLQLGMLIPIPPKDSPSKQLTESGFRIDCDMAIEEMKKDEVYGEKMKTLLSKIRINELRNLMIAIAKSECGGKLGAFATFRYEKAHKVFSYSVFHVLMKGAGLKARRNLNLTEGQLEHPLNAAKLFLAFMFEKAGKKGLEQYFPIKNHFEDFSSFYNGNWRLAEKKAKEGGAKLLAYPDNYPTKLKNYYNEVEMVDIAETKKR